MTWYSYLWLREHDGTFPAGTPYYAGKGKVHRGFRKLSHRFSPPKDKNHILVQQWESEGEAFEAEKFLILFYGRIDNGTGCLRNLTDGGEGTSGIRRAHSIESRRKMSESAKIRFMNNPMSQETRRKIANASRFSPASFAIKPPSKESREKARRAITGRFDSLETKRRKSESAKEAWKRPRK